ncbi:helix-turn-helix transcriptional regulator [Consotaella aegiceratis]|uniref:helix-turn-helix transcriptional regulator n=1 Tax=Consotaella aegiceratis TaxID=3097961 RepID=UPI002F42314A
MSDRWPDAIEAMSALAGSFSGAIFVSKDGRITGNIVSRNMLGVMAMGLQRGDLSRSARVKRAMAAGRPSFIRIEDIQPEDEALADPVAVTLRQFDLTYQIFATLPLPGGEMLTATFERLEKNGRYRDREIAALNGLLPHLSRAGIITARLAMERIQTMVETLDKLGLPGAVIDLKGRVLAANAILESFRSIFQPNAFGGIALVNATANRRFVKALSEASDHQATTTIALSGDRMTAPLLIHLIPVAGAAHDILMGGATLLFVSPLDRIAPPDPAILSGLFDLSPAEARLVGTLLAGATLNQAAAHYGVAASTVRSQLLSIFDKTGVHRQSDLMRLLARL